MCDKDSRTLEPKSEDWSSPSREDPKEPKTTGVVTGRKMVSSYLDKVITLWVFALLETLLRHQISQ